MAGNLTIQELFGYAYLTGVVEAVKSGIPDLLPPAFHSVTQEVIGDAGLYTITRGTRKLSRRVEYGSPAIRAPLVGIETKPVKLAHTFEEITIKPQDYMLLRNYNDYNLMKRGKDELDRQQAQFRWRSDNFRISMIYSMLANGKIWFDENGNLLPSSAGAYVTVDFEIPANNQNQLNGIIAASWALSNTDIPLHLRNLRSRAAQDSGYPIKYAFYGVNIPTYLTQNNYVLDYLARSPKYQTAFLENAEIPDGLFGFTWVPVYSAFFEDHNGTNQTFFGADTVTFTPDINVMVYEFLVGSMEVPTTFGPVNDLLAAMNSFKTVYGQFAYGWPTHNPPTANMYQGDTCLPVWKIPATMYNADVTP